MGVLTNLAEGDVLLITGIDRLTKSPEGRLRQAMTEGKQLRLQIDEKIKKAHRKPIQKPTQ